MGHGVIVSRAKRLSDSMIVAGVHALAKLSPALKDPKMPLLPDRAPPRILLELMMLVSEVREASVKVASAVALAAKQEGAATVDVPEDEREREKKVRDAMWQPACACDWPACFIDPRADRPLVLRDPDHALSRASFKTVPSARLETCVRRKLPC